MINFKYKKDIKLFSQLHPALIMIFSDLYLYAKDTLNKELTITSTISTPSEDSSLQRVSSSHLQHRALDISAKNLSHSDIQKMMDYIHKKDAYKKYHYLSNSGIKRLLLFHNNGNGDHFHLAIHARYAITNS
jgi:hypothetical protein